tara:strand:- start:1547 stop:2167 length:621 start_codon:yes stop_codon:yes gene_type:complete
MERKDKSGVLDYLLSRIQDFGGNLPYRPEGGSTVYTPNVERYESDNYWNSEIARTRGESLPMYSYDDPYMMTSSQDKSGAQEDFWGEYLDTSERNMPYSDRSIDDFRSKEDFLEYQDRRGVAKKFHKEPRILKIAPELPSDSEGLKIHKQNYKNVNGPEYVRKVGGAKTSELDGNGITNEIFNEMGDFDLMDEQIPNHSKKTNIPY